MFEFEKNNLNVVGVNTVIIQSQRYFISLLELNFPVLNDNSNNVSIKYRALNLLGGSECKMVLINTEKKILNEKLFYQFTC